MKRFPQLPVLFVVALASAVALAPAATGDPNCYNGTCVVPVPPQYTAQYVCSMRAAGHDDMGIAERIQADMNVDFFYIEQYVTAAERAQCPQYLNGVSQAGPPVLPGPGV